VAATPVSGFDAGALLTFNGLRSLVDAVGGIDLYVDQKTVSIHMRPDGTHRVGCSSCAHGFGGPQMTYNVGMRHLSGWQALDYSRQRYLPGADYTRGRHQRQVIKAIIAQVAKTDLMTNPVALTKLIKGLNTGIIVDTRGRQPIELAYALRNLRASALTLVGLPGSGAYSGGTYIGENLSSVQASFFAAMRQDTLDSYLASHKSLVNSDPR
jgi:anionic cell wall polymer biosynthesis LytR-Cps2A-Psr (LCP) family protein